MFFKNPKGKISEEDLKEESSMQELDETKEKSDKSGSIEHYAQKYFCWNMTEADVRDMCRHQIDAFEHWSRRLIDEVFRENYGEEYIKSYVSKDQPLFKKEIRDRIVSRMKEDPSRFPRVIDAIIIEDLEYFFCRDDLYKLFFKQVFEPFYSGQGEVRSVIQRISAIRNKLSHGNTVSVHEAEQSVCYTNDFIEAFKEHYRRQGKNKEYNVPVILSVHDNLGNAFNRKDYESMWEFWPGHAFIDYPNSTEIKLRSGEKYRLTVEVDPSFPENFYDIEWKVKCSYSEEFASGKGKCIEFTVTDKMVSRCPEIWVWLTTHRTWHRFAGSNCDDFLKYSLSQVLPPIEDTY